MVADPRWEETGVSPYYLLPNLSVIRTKTRKTLRDLWKHLKRPENQAPVSSRAGHGSGLGARAGSASPPPGAASSLPGRSRVGCLPGSFNLGAGHPPSSAGSGPPRGAAGAPGIPPGRPRRPLSSGADRLAMGPVPGGQGPFFVIPPPRAAGGHRHHMPRGKLRAPHKPP